MGVSTQQFLLIVVAGISVGVGVSLLGTFVILRRMALVGDALSHVALPGIALAVTYKLNPFLGAVVFLFLAVFAITLIERHSVLPVDALVGVFFTAGLGIGALISPSAESLLEALFGDIAKLNMVDAEIAVGAGLLVAIVTLLLFRDFAYLTLSPELAHSEGVPVERTELIFLLLLATIVAVGIRLVGALLVGALIIIPASIAKNVTVSLKGMAFVSAAVGVVTVVGGSSIAAVFHLPPGPVVTTVAAGFFLVSLFIRRS